MTKVISGLTIGFTSDWAQLFIPTAFSTRVRNALKAEATSVRLAGLVGAGGMWYGFGKTVMDVYVACSVPKWVTH